MILPVARYPTPRSRHRLVERMLARRSQLRPVDVLPARVVKEPVLAGLEALDDGVSFVLGMAACVLRWRRIAATDMAAARAAAEVQPPTARGKTLDATRAAGRHRRIDIHLVSLRRVR